MRCRTLAAVAAVSSSNLAKHSTGFIAGPQAIHDVLPQCCSKWRQGCTAMVPRSRACNNRQRQGVLMLAKKKGQQSKTRRKPMSESKKAALGQQAGPRGGTQVLEREEQGNGGPQGYMPGYTPSEPDAGDVDLAELPDVPLPPTIISTEPTHMQKRERPVGGQPQESEAGDGIIEFESEAETEGFVDDDERLAEVAQAENTIQYIRDNNLTLDPETMQALVLPKDAKAKRAKVFPRPTPEMTQKYYMGQKPGVDEMVSRMLELLPLDSADVTALKEFSLANRMHMGERMLAVVVALKLKAQSQLDRERAIRLRHLSQGLLKTESALVAPFKQAMKDAEQRMSPYMGNNEVQLYSGKDSAEASCTWLVLKACVAEWEKRLRELAGDEESKQLYEVLPPVLQPKYDYDLDRTARICAATQQMSVAFSQDEKLMKLVEPELRFTEQALGFSITSEVRRYAIKEFCPQEGISPEELRFRMRSLLVNLRQLSKASYGSLYGAIRDIYDCLAEGTVDTYNIYMDNYDQIEFPTYSLWDVGPETEDNEYFKKLVMDDTALDGAAQDDKEWEQLFDSMNPLNIFNSLLPKAPRLEKGWLELLDDLRPLRQVPTGPGEEDDEDDMAVVDSSGDIYADFEKEFGLQSEDETDVFIEDGIPDADIVTGGNADSTGKGG